LKLGIDLVDIDREEETRLVDGFSQFVGKEITSFEELRELMGEEGIVDPDSEYDFVVDFNTDEYLRGLQFVQPLIQFLREKEEVEEE